MHRKIASQTHQLISIPTVECLSLVHKSSSVRNSKVCDYCTTHIRGTLSLKVQRRRGEQRLIDLQELVLPVAKLPKDLQRIRSQSLQHIDGHLVSGGDLASMASS